MIEAYILLTVQPGFEGKIYDTLKALKGTSEVNELYGEWDIILNVKAESLEELNTIVTDKIRCIKEIKLTSTMIVAKNK